jgi:hypothetical protein
MEEFIPQSEELLMRSWIVRIPLAAKLRTKCSPVVSWAFSALLSIDAIWGHEKRAEGLGTSF